MKPHTALFFLAAFLLTASTVNKVNAQQYKLRQTTNMMGMKSESTIYVKGMRKRTEGGGFMGQPNNLVTIEQCDRQRTITLNDKKKLYYIEPFSKEAEEVIDEDAKPAVKPVVKPKVVTGQPKTGGTITMYYNITDTGERKKMYGFTARHVWTTQKMKPSPDACTMKDSMIIKTDGWYIDLPEFNCPIRYKPVQTNNTGGYQKPDCQDKFVTRRSGKGKTGFPLIEKRTMIMGGGNAATSEFVTDLETLELTTGKLDSMLFEIPPGYSEAKSMSELEDKFDPTAMIKQYTDQYKKEGDDNAVISDVKKPGMLRIGVFEPKGGEQLQAGVLQQHLVSVLQNNTVEAVAVNTEEEARKLNCDLLLNTDIVKMKQASKVGGLLKAIKNADPNAATSFNIEANMLLTNLADGSVRTEQSVNGKYEGKPDDAAKKALDEGGRLVLKALR